MPTYGPNPGWPDALYRLVTTDNKVRRAKFSATELIQPPQMLQLKRRHAETMTVDPSDMLWRMFGKLLHGKLEANAGVNSLIEEGLIYQCGTETVSGQPDCYEDETIWDYKVTSVWAVKEGVKPEWEQQLNIYAAMFRAAGFPVNHLRIVAILRDWSAAVAKRDETYPKNQIKVLKVKLWGVMEASAFIAERVALHLAAESLADAELPPCTDAERWASPTKYAVMEKGKKRATKLHDDEEEAKRHADSIPGARVDLRPGEYKRCADYCEAAPFCKQWGAGLTVDEKLDAAGL